MDAPNPIIEEYKRKALELAALQAPGSVPLAVADPAAQRGGLPDISPMANPMPNIQAPPLQGVTQASSVAPAPPVVTPVQIHPGPIKSFLQQFVHGAGQGLLTNAGLENDSQRQQRLFNQGIATQGAARQGQLINAQIGNYQSEADARNAQNSFVPDDVAKQLGLTGQVLVKDLPKILVSRQQGANQAGVQTLRNQGNLATTELKYGDGSKPGPLNTVIKDIGGRTYLLRKGTGEKLSDLGESNSIATANARAEAQARYGLTNTMDENGNPVSESRLSAIQGGNPSVNFDAIKQIKSDQVGIGQYESILKDKISPNLKALNDPTQRAIIAHTLAEAEKNPGAIQALLTAGAQSGLSPQGAALAAGILQGREFGNVARKYGGNMNGTEGLMNRIMSNQASPLNSEQLNRELIQNDLAFTKKAQGTLGGLTSHRQSGAAAPAASPATPAPSGLPSWDRGPI